MSRSYTQLECGCLISCDGGGGLIQGCGYWDDVEKAIIPSKDCKVQEYFNIHNKWAGGYCKICHSLEYEQYKIECNVIKKTTINVLCIIFGLWMTLYNAIEKLWKRID